MKNETNKNEKKNIIIIEMCALLYNCEKQNKKQNYFILTVIAKPIACRNSFHFRLETIHMISLVA